MVLKTAFTVRIERTVAKRDKASYQSNLCFIVLPERLGKSIYHIGSA